MGDQPDFPWLARYLSHIDMSGGPDACWPWSPLPANQRYAQVAMGGRVEYAHRIAFFLATGYWPEPLCRHTCDNPPCCNPHHLAEGTDQDNQDDAWSRGRRMNWIGERHPQSKLTVAQVRQMRADHASGMPVAAAARKYGVHYGTAKAVIERRTWKEVE